MDLVVHVIDPFDRDEMRPAAGLRVVLGQNDTVGAFLVVNSADVLAIGTHHFHMVLNVETFEHAKTMLTFRIRERPRRRRIGDAAWGHYETRDAPSQITDLESGCD